VHAGVRGEDGVRGGELKMSDISERLGMRVRIAAIAVLMSAMAAHAQTVTTAAGPAIKLSWSAVLLGTSATTTNGVTTTKTITLTGTTTYNLYQGACNSVAIFVKVQSGIAGTSAVVSAGITPGVTYGFRVTAVNTGTAGLTTPESPQSVTICAVVGTASTVQPVTPPPAIQPNAPTGFVVLPS